MAKVSMDCKILMAKEISERLSTAPALIVTNYKGLTAQDLNSLRKALRDVSGEYIVVKDSIVKKALSEGPNSTISEFIEGEVGIVVDRQKDPISIAKVLAKFAKDKEVLNIRGGVMGGALLSKEDVVTLAMIPSREVLLARLANVLNAPIQGLVGALIAIITKLVYALNAVKDRVQETGTKDEKKNQGGK